MKTANSTKKIASVADFFKYSDDMIAKESRNTETPSIYVCTGGGCIASGSLELIAALEEELGRRKLGDKVRLVRTGCMGPCAGGPVVAAGSRADALRQNDR